jgi:transposase-like protein
MAKSKVQEWLTEDRLILLQGWARDGLTDEQIAHNMGINVRTLYKWKKKYGQIGQALKKGKEVVDRQVENALLRSALGYEYEEQALTNKGEVVTLRKYQHPNITAAIFWLKNRKPQEWRDKQQVEHTGKDDGPIEFIAEWGGNVTSSKD